MGPYPTHEGVGLTNVTTHRSIPLFASSDWGISIGALGVAFGFLDVREWCLETRRAVKDFLGTSDRCI
jgi:hypothetical protein